MNEKKEVAAQCRFKFNVLLLTEKLERPQVCH